MKKKINQVSYLMVTIILAFGLFSCNITNSDNKTGKMDLSITEKVSRTILPELSMEPASYEITGTGPDSATFTEISTDASVTVDKLAFGEWTVTVTAFNQDGTAIGLGSNSITVHSNETSNLTVVVTPLSGTGSLDLTLNWIEADVDSPEVVASLLPSNGTATDLVFTLNKDNATYSGIDIDDGYYTLTLQLLDNGILTLGTVEVVKIVKGQITIGIFTFDNIKEAEGTINTNIDIKMENPLDVLIVGATENKPENESFSLTASVSDYTDNVTYVWYVDGNSAGTGETFNFDDSWVLGPYDVSVTAFSIDGSRAGSRTVSIEVIEATVMPMLEKTEMVAVTGGAFEDENGYTQTISDFSIGQYEITYELWSTVYTWALENGYNFANAGVEGHDGSVGYDPTLAKYEPVTMISWRDAVVWCNAYSEYRGLIPAYGYNGLIVKDSRGSSINVFYYVTPNPDANGYRLPTEEEWRFAANGGNNSNGYAYSGSNAIDDVAWYQDNSDGKTNNVGGKQSNELGLYDMSGNVGEWCSTLYSHKMSAYYICGGNWDSSINTCSIFSSGYDYLASAKNHVGFRIAQN